MSGMRKTKLMKVQRMKNVLISEIDSLKKECEALQTYSQFLDNNLSTALLKLTENGNLSKNIVVDKSKENISCSEKIINIYTNELENYPHFIENEISKLTTSLEAIDDSNQLRKRWHIEGKVRDIAYSIVMVTEQIVKDNIISPHKVEEILNISISRNLINENPFFETCKATKSVSDLFYGLLQIQVLEKEREEAAEEISHFPDVEVVGQGSSVVTITYQATSLHQISVTWSFILIKIKEIGVHYKHDIIVDGTAGVEARFSRSHAYEYLSRQKHLRTKDKVIEFFEKFQD